ncbi:MAG: PIN domain-containing protein [Planctomycetaceae bacterium]|jgi:predicted nucleic acid-binding protein|nr:PIN domain-containing protein [Planctomycetaceae bacterium]
MKQLKIYLDMCCYNRPFDEQNKEIIRLETQAKLEIQHRIKQGIYLLVWSYMLDYENKNNPFEQKRNTIESWREIAAEYEEGDDETLAMGKRFMKFGLRHKDSIHLACAVKHNCDYIITTDRKFINKKNQVADIKIVNPVIFLLETEEIQ